MKGQLTGMTGVYLVAAELSRRGFIASPTSRSAQGADLLVTTPDCSRTYAVQVKTNATTFTFWLMSKKNISIQSKTFVYALVNLRKDDTEFFIVPSHVVAANILVSKPSKNRKSTWYSFSIDHAKHIRIIWKSSSNSNNSLHLTAFPLRSASGGWAWTLSDPWKWEPSLREK